jgi:CubicO group peptidase (beta-lactamase class C family)
MGEQMHEPSQTLGGYVAERFDGVREAFERLLRDPSERGVGVAMVVDGECVVDLAGCGPMAEPDEWNEGSAVTVFSCTKGAVALCVHLLASEGELDLDQAVGSRWPEFARNGKAEISPRMLLNHSAGIPGLSEEPPAAELRDDVAMADRLAAERPLWAPGRAHGYHPVTYGWALGEVVRRVTGQRVGSFLRERFAVPLGLDLWIGVPDSERHRVSVAHLGDDPYGDRFNEALERSEPVQLAVMRAGAALEPWFVNDPATWAAELPGTNGVATARGLAELYAVTSSRDRALDFGFDEVALDRMWMCEWAGAEDRVYFEPYRYASGFSTRDLIASAGAFGHGGLGGSFGLADPTCGASMAFVTNRHEKRERELDRAQSLLDALYRALGFRRRARDLWVR